MVVKITKLSEYIKELEKIKEEHGDLPVKIETYNEHYMEYELTESDYPLYVNKELAKLYEDEECVVVGR